jgi:hypothetical protein
MTAQTNTLSMMHEWHLLPSETGHIKTPWCGCRPVQHFESRVWLHNEERPCPVCGWSKGYHGTWCPERSKEVGHEGEDG